MIEVCVLLRLLIFHNVTGSINMDNFKLLKHRMYITTAGLSGIEIRMKTLQTKSNILWLQLVWIRHIIMC